MHYEFFRVSTASPQAASEELNRFISSHRVVHVEKYFHADGPDGYWSFCLQCQDSATDSRSPQSKTSPKVDYKAVLTEVQFAVYSRLREQRKLISERDGVPVYAVATNEHLAAMVRGPITSKTGLMAIPGFGDAKTERYGESFLALIRQSADKLVAPHTDHVGDASDASSTADKSD
ncbi:MAG TPA: HRDC domain-containing protein [Planctomycetaceae bacterium]|nr:HRDC domain-containing protein [Planctomycetaceae bacterium]HRA87346.1 HRDC domain-containing protein [Planctomycetaceae bacterium]